VKLKESSEEKETASKIRNMLIPKEFTRLDEMVEIMFATASDIEAASEEVPEVDESEAELAKTNELRKALLQRQRDRTISAVERKLRVKLIKRTRALYWDATHKVRIACTISKEYTRHKSHSYWYAYHPQWDEFLEEGEDSYFVLGCMGVPAAFAIPWKVIHSVLGSLNTTTTDEGRTYWHIYLTEPRTGAYTLLVPKGSKQISLDEYRVSFPVPL
jgi:hypothetical protein